MLSPTDVRAGNWVIKIVGSDKNGDSFLEYRSIALDECYSTSAAACFSIALSPGILAFCGFKQESGGWQISLEEEGIEKEVPLLRYEDENKTWYIGGFKIPAQPLYVHQVQNLYYALTGQELKVNLGFFTNRPLFGPITFFNFIQRENTNEELL